MEGHLPVLEVEGHGALAGGDGHGGAAVQLRQRLLEERRLAERRAHEEEARAREREQRDLPGGASIPVRVVVELVHHHVVRVRGRALAERLVREDLRRAADDEGARVDLSVPRHHPHELGPELARKREELLVHQRLDGRRVIRPLPLRDRDEVVERGDQRFPGARGRREDHVLPGDELEERLLLRGIEGEPELRHVREEAVEQVLGEDLPRGGRQVRCERCVAGHRRDSGTAWGAEEGASGPARPGGRGRVAAT